MGFPSRMVLSLAFVVSTLSASAAKLPEGTKCEVKKPIALFKKPKGKKRLGKLTQGEAFVIKQKKGRRFAVVLNDGREGFVGSKAAHRFCEKPSVAVMEACITEADLPLFKKAKGKKRIGKVATGTRIEIGRSFRYRKGVTLADGTQGFIPKKKLKALCVRAPIVKLGGEQPGAPAVPATPATPAKAAAPAIPAQPATPAQPAQPATSPVGTAGGPKSPSVSAPIMAVPVVPTPAVPGAVVPSPRGPVSPATTPPVVISPEVPAPESPAGANASANKKETKGDKASSAKDGDASGSDASNKADEAKPKDSKSDD